MHSTTMWLAASVLSSCIAQHMNTFEHMWLALSRQHHYLEAFQGHGHGDTELPHNLQVSGTAMMFQHRHNLKLWVWLLSVDCCVRWVNYNLNRSRNAFIILPHHVQLE